MVKVSSAIPVTPLRSLSAESSCFWNTSLFRSCGSKQTLSFVISPLSLVDSDRTVLFTKSMGVLTLKMTRNPVSCQFLVYRALVQCTWTGTDHGGWTIDSALGSRVMWYGFIWNFPNYPSKWSWKSVRSFSLVSGM